MGSVSGGHCDSGSKLHRRNVVNISMEVLSSIFCNIISVVHSNKSKTQVVCGGSGCTVILGVNYST